VARLPGTTQNFASGRDQISRSAASKLGQPVRDERGLGRASTSDQRNQPQECDLAPRRDVERFVQGRNLVVVEENEEAVAFERGYGVC
jgi:hypothetical protein